jgi:hypothetical protein
VKYSSPTEVLVVISGALVAVNDAVAVEAGVVLGDQLLEELHVPPFAPV